MNAEELNKRWDAAMDAAFAAHMVYHAKIAEFGINDKRTLKARIEFHQASGYSDALRDLCKIELGVHRPVTVSEVQPDGAQSVTDNTCMYCYHSYVDCNCDYCELEGHDWIGLSGSRACRSCGIEELTPLSWMEEAVEEALREDQALEAAVKTKKPKSKLAQLQAAFDDAKQTCLAFPADGQIEFKRGHGYYIFSPFERKTSKTNRTLTFCWLGNFERGMRFIVDAKSRRIPNFSLVSVGLP